MYMYDLNKEQKEVAIQIVMKELKQIGFNLNADHAGDRQKAEVLAINLRMKFNQLGGLA